MIDPRRKEDGTLTKEELEHIEKKQQEVVESTEKHKREEKQAAC